MPQDASLLVSLTTPITDTELSLVSLHGTEALSVPFDYTVRLSSTNASVDFSTVLAQPIVVTLTAADGTSQYLNGTVVEFAQEDEDMRPRTLYRARLRPAFWLLSMRSDYVIYQNKSVPDILEAAFSAASFTTYRNSLTGTYAALDYVVQYGESTMDFASRLMEDAGIFYYFEHTTDACTLVLADDASTYGTLPGSATLTHKGIGTSGDAGEVLQATVQQQLVPTSYKLNDYNFTAPATALLATSSGATTYQLAEYPGGYLTKSVGDTKATLRLSAVESRAKLLRGRSAASSFHVGYQFTLAGHPKPDANAAWALSGVALHIEGDQYTNEFTAFPATVTYRPERVTPRPRIHGTQTATVTGKAGEEIWTDSYGRVKVKFHWDTSSAADETTSCWVRVAQAWAGKTWGSIFVPRIGTEVIVTFLNGDPDQPLIVGTLYNATQTMPYTLPDDQTKMSFKTQSSTGGQGFNELRFDDKAGSEELFLQAQKDLNVSVVKGNYTLNVTTGNETHSTKGTRSLTVEGNETHTNKADYKQDITGNLTESVSGNAKHDITGNFTLNVSGNLVIKATGSVDIESGTGFTAKAGTSMAISSGLDTSVKANTQLALEGSATAELKGGATAAVKGGLVQIN